MYFTSTSFVRLTLNTYFLTFITTIEVLFRFAVTRVDEVTALFQRWYT